MLTKAFGVLALLVLAAIVTGVAASATTTAVPRLLTGKWNRGDGFVVMVVGPRGKVNVSKGAFAAGDNAGWYHLKFSHITEHRFAPLGRLTISGIRSCSGTGTYRWTVKGGFVIRLTFKVIHDACKQRVTLFADPNPWAWTGH